MLTAQTLKLKKLDSNPTLPVPICMTLDILFYFSKPLFLHYQNSEVMGIVLSFFLFIGGGGGTGDQSIIGENQA